jgi:uncharacterized protein YndB with AHSA1/START domain
MTMTDNVVRKSVVVDAPVDKAFRVFTEAIDRWWIRQHHIGSAELAEVVIEPRAGGRWYERGVDGSECDWGHVIRWDPPEGLVLAWQIDATWHFDPALVTEVEVRFVAESPLRTKVELEHRLLERFGDASESMRAGFESEGGWQTLLEVFAAATR